MSVQDIVTFNFWHRESRTYFRGFMFKISLPTLNDALKSLSSELEILEQDDVKMFFSVKAGFAIALNFRTASRVVLLFSRSDQRARKNIENRNAENGNAKLPLAFIRPDLSCRCTCGHECGALFSLAKVSVFTAKPPSSECESGKRLKLFNSWRRRLARLNESTDILMSN